MFMKGKTVSDMARYYESETLIEFVKKYIPHLNGETTLECVERAIREAPTADVAPKSSDTIEVIRCKNCEYWDKYNITKHPYSSEDKTLVDYAECEKWSNSSTCYKTKYDDYCSEAERDVSIAEGGE